MWMASHDARVVLIIEYLSQNLDGSSGTAMSRDLGIPKPTLYRAIRALSSAGYVVWQHGNIRLSSRFATLGHIIRRAYGWPDISLPYMKKLSRLTSQTVKLSVLVGREVEVLLRTEPDVRLRVAVDEGARFPLTAGAASKVLLSFSSESDWMSVARERLTPYTKNTIVDPTEFLNALREIRRTGVGCDRGEFVSDIHAVAVPVFDEAKRVIAALSIAYPRLIESTDSVSAWSHELKICSERISEGLLLMPQKILSEYNEK